MSLAKIVSGGQTGVDRGALDAALERTFPCGGWCSVDRMAEDRAIPQIYPLKELDSDSSRERTVRNIVDSDATVVVYFDQMQGGIGQIALHCVANRKPHRLIDGAMTDVSQAAAAIREFVEANNSQVLNVAGSLASKEARAYDYTYRVILELIDSGV